jgi:hypothetical protein
MISWHQKHRQQKQKLSKWDIKVKISAQQRKQQSENASYEMRENI